MTATTVDAVVIGAGHNGLVAACRLADAGWDVCLLEAADHVGGAVASATTVPGYVMDLYSAFYPLAAASPAIRRLDLHHHGLKWAHAPAVLAHPHPPAPGDAGARRAAIMHRRPEDTAAGLDAETPGDGDAWMALVEQWQHLRDPVLEALLTPFPPARAALRMLHRMSGRMSGRMAGRMSGTAGALRTIRTLMLPVDQLGRELFRGPDARLLLSGSAMHADIPTVAPGSGGFGWLLCMLGQDVGFPVPVGGAAALPTAMAARARAAGAELRTGHRVRRVVVGGGRALGVDCADGQRIRVRRAVLADVAAPTLYRDLLTSDAVPPRLLADLERFTWDLPTVKVNWALDGPIPWQVEAIRGAGTVHLGADDGQLAEWSAALTAGRPSEHTFLLLGQMAVADPTRAPEGCDSVWGYSHLPRDTTDPAAGLKLADQMEQEVERHAPGFRDRIVHRLIQLPGDLETADANLVAGAVNGGTAQLFQQFIFRPVPGLGRPETPVAGLYLASAGAHPGGGVHGACGDNAARAALRGSAWGGVPGRALARLSRRLYD